VTGLSNRFYTISQVNLYGNTAAEFDSTQAYIPWDDDYVNFLSGGYSVNAWGLFTPDGSQEISPQLAATLFGSLPTLQYYPDIATTAGGSFYQWALPPGGIVTRADAFLDWGKDVPGYSPGTLVPATQSAGSFTNSDYNWTKVVYLPFN
jgi:hypothetical protein